MKLPMSERANYDIHPRVQVAESPASEMPVRHGRYLSDMGSVRAVLRLTSAHSIRREILCIWRQL